MDLEISPVTSGKSLHTIEDASLTAVSASPDKDSRFAELERRHRRTLRALKTLSLSNKTLVRTRNEDRLLQEVCDIAVKVGGYRMAWVGYGATAAQLRMVATSGYVGDYFKRPTSAAPACDCPADLAMRSGMPYVMNDIARDLELPDLKSIALAEGYKAGIILPLMLSDSERLGIFVIYAEEIDSFDEEEVELLAELAADLGCGLEHISVDRQREAAERELRASNKKLERMLFDLVQSMGRIVEVRDPYTRGHEERVAQLCTFIARELGWSQSDVEAIEMTALVHDIGKLCVPSEILSKPGSLTDVERMLVQQHPLRGHDILCDIDFPWPVAQTVLQHHERIDGSGYPNGLAGEEILLPARLLAVADVVEAIASHRPYRASLGMEAAIAELTGSPAAYDSSIVEAVLSLHERDELSFLN